MAYGRLGPSGYMQLGRMAQAGSPPPGGLDSLPRTVTPAPTPPPDPESVESRSSPAQEMARLLYDRDSASRGDELSNQPGEGFSGGPSDFISREPGAMSIFGLSTGSAYDPLGRAYDTANFDVGAAVGSLAGNLLGGPVGGIAGSTLGRQADLNTVLGSSRAGSRDFGQGGVGQMSRGERRAFDEAREAVMARPMPQNLTSTELALRQASQRRQERDSNTPASETTGAVSQRGRAAAQAAQSRAASTRGRTPY